MMLVRSRRRAGGGARWKRRIIVNAVHHVRPKQVANFSATVEPAGDHLGAMIALRIPDDVAREIWVAGEEQANLHITLVYVKGEDLTPEISIVYDRWKHVRDSVQVTLTELRSFPPTENSDGKWVLYAAVESEGLLRARRMLCDMLDEAGIKWGQDFAYNPHVTLAYLDYDPMAAGVRTFQRIRFEATDSLLTLPRIAGGAVDATLNGDIYRVEAQKLRTLPTLNARYRQRPNPLRHDPSRTAGERRAFRAEIGRRFLALRRAIKKLVVDEDAFGIEPVENVFCPTGPGGGVDPSCASGGAITKGMEAIKEIHEKADSVLFSDMLSRDTSIDRSDLDDIEAKLKPREAEKLQDFINEAEQNFIDQEMESFEPDVSRNEVIEAVADQATVARAMDELIEEHGGESKAELLKESDDWYQESNTSGPDAVDELRDRLRGVEGHSDEIDRALRGYRDDLGVEIDKAVEHREDELRDEHRESLSSDYDSYEARREWLRDFYDNNAGRFQASNVPEKTWALDDEGDHVLRFHTSSGNEYNVFASDRKYAEQPVVEFGFSDDEGSFKITKAGGAHEVFSNVIASVVAYAKKKDVGVMIFSAAEQSRRRLYDRIVRTVAAAMPGYFAGYSDKGGQQRTYLVAKREVKDAVVGLAKLQDPEFSILVNSLHFVMLLPCIWVVNTRWKFHATADQLGAFRDWLKTQLQLQGLLFEHLKVAEEHRWWQRYIEQVYKKGQGRAFDQVMKKKIARNPALQDKMDFYHGSRENFLRSSFQQPATVEKVKALASRNFGDLKGMSEDMQTRLGRALVDGLINGKHPKEIGKELEEQLDISERRAMTIAATEITRAQALGQLDAMENLGMDKVGIAVEWTTAAGDTEEYEAFKVCPQCQPMSHVVLSIEEARKVEIPRHPNCLLPGNYIQGRITAALEVHYSGEVVELRTSKGARVSLTVNHPVLTENGFVFAGKLKKGDNLLCHFGESQSSIDPDIQQCPALVEQVFNSFPTVLCQEPVTGFDFNGDEKFMVGKVNVVLPALGFGENLSDKGESEDQVLLISSDDRSMCSTSLSESLLFGHPRPLQKLGLALGAEEYSRVNQSSMNYSGTDVEAICNSIRGLPSLIPSTNLFSIDSKSMPNERRFGSASNLDVSFTQPGLNGIGLDTNLVSELLERFPSKISLDQVVYVYRFHYSGPVYDVESTLGYFTTNQGGPESIIIKNCRCAWLPANTGEDDEDQVRTKRAIEKALDRSVDAEGGEDETDWVGADADIAKKRPESIFKEAKNRGNN